MGRKYCQIRMTFWPLRPNTFRQIIEEIFKLLWEKKHCPAECLTQSYIASFPFLAFKCCECQTNCQMCFVFFRWEGVVCVFFILNHTWQVWPHPPINTLMYPFEMFLSLQLFTFCPAPAVLLRQPCWKGQPVSFSPPLLFPHTLLFYSLPSFQNILPCRVGLT